MLADVGAQALLGVEPFQVGGDAAQCRVGGHSFSSRVARKEIGQSGVGQRFHRELARSAAIEGGLVVEQVHHHPDVGAGQHQDERLVFQQVVPGGLQV